MKTPSLIQALRDAGVLSPVRAIIVEYPALDEVIKAFADYLSLLPKKEGKDEQPLVVDCLASAVNAFKRSKRLAAMDPSVSLEIAFVEGLLYLTPALLKMSICSPSHVENESICWVPFAESIGEFSSRYPQARVYYEIRPEAQFLSDDDARELIAARVLPVRLAKYFIHPAPTPEVAEAQSA